MLNKEGQDHSLQFANGTRFLSKVPCLAVTELPLLYLTCRGKWGCTFDYFIFHPWLPLLKGVTHPFIYCSRHEVFHHHPAQAAIYPDCAHVLTVVYFLSVCLPPCLAASPQVTSASAFCAPHCKGCLLPCISAGLGRTLLQQVSLQSTPNCVLGYSVPLLLFLSFSQGSLIFQGCQRKICSSESSLWFLVWVLILTSPQTVQRCSRVIRGVCCFLTGQILITGFTRFSGSMGLVVASRNVI